MSFKVNKFSNISGATYLNDNILQRYYPKFCYKTTASCETVELYVYLMMKKKMDYDLQLLDANSKEKCDISPNALNITGKVNIRVEPFGCWSKRPSKEYEQAANLDFDKMKKFILDWNCPYSGWWPQDKETSITVYFDNVIKEEIFNNPDIDCPKSKSNIIGGMIITIIIIIVAILYWNYNHDGSGRAGIRTVYLPIWEEPDITSPDHNTLLELLSNISYKWNLIGIALGVSNTFIQSLTGERIDNTMRLSHVLMEWIENDDDVTWDKIIRVIEGDIVKSKKTANKMKRYIQSLEE